MLCSARKPVATEQVVSRSPPFSSFPTSALVSVAVFRLDRAGCYPFGLVALAQAMQTATSPVTCSRDAFWALPRRVARPLPALYACHRQFISRDGDYPFLIFANSHRLTSCNRAGDG